jgi:hypothetical protein
LPLGALKNVKVNGILVKRKTYRFSNAEEAAGLTDVVPFLLEDALQNGFIFFNRRLASLCSTRWFIDHRSKPRLN